MGFVKRYLNHFRVRLGLRLAGLFACMLALAFGLVNDLRVSLLAILVIATLAFSVSLVRYINRTNRELESFIAGLKFGDYQQRYTIAHLGPSFRGLEVAMQRAVDWFRTQRTKQEQEALYFRSLMQHMPVPFLVIHSDRKVDVMNHATRRAFNVADLNHTDALARFGAGFQRDVLQIRAGEALLTTIEVAGNREYFIMTATELTVGAKARKLVALQNVQGELDATELATWQELLRVTSHEILNSLAPVASCAQIAKSLVDDLLARQLDGDTGTDPESMREDLEDIRVSVDTVLRRSQGLRRFIQSYRQLSRMPPPSKQRIELGDYFERLASLVRSELARKDIELEFKFHPPSLHVAADEDMLDQVLINLIRNAADALSDSTPAKIEVSAYLDERQHAVIDVMDNGPGVPEDLVEQIFVPFFTTRDQGSGIGLALSRYIMLSHGGKLSCLGRAGGGSIFRLGF